MFKQILLKQYNISRQFTHLAKLAKSSQNAQITSLSFKQFSIADYFTAPVIQERTQKRIVMVDTKEAFQRIEKEHSYLTYDQCVEIFNDLAYVVMPFDKTQKEFQSLITRLKVTLQNQTGNVKLLDLIDGLNRLGIENFSGLIKKKIQEDNYSRSPGELSAILFFLAQQHKMYGIKYDTELFVKVIKDLKYCDVSHLKIEHLHFMMKAFTLAMEEKFQMDLKNPKEMQLNIEEFLPKVIDQISLELTRCNIADVIMMLESFFKFWNRSNFQNSRMKSVYQSCEAYLDQFLGLSKKDITGSQFAQLVEQMANAKVHKLYQFDQKLIHRMQHIFINDHSELYNFSIKDITKVLVGFDVINDYFNKQKLIDSLIEIVFDFDQFQDQDYLELMNILDAKGYFAQYQDLIVKCRFYFQQRFNYMEKESIIGYLELMQRHGLVFEDKELMNLIASHVQKNYHQYELNELFQIFRIISHNFYRDQETIKLIEDAVKIRLSDKSQYDCLSPYDLRDLIEGLSLQTQFNKKLDSALKILIKETNLMSLDKKLLIQLITYLSNFNSKIDEKLQNKISIAIDANLSGFTTQELAHLALYIDHYKEYSLLRQLNEDEIENDFASLEKLALRGEVKLNEEKAIEYIKKQDESSNMLEVIEQILGKAGLQFEKNKLLCENRLKAAFVINNNVLVDVIDNQMAYYEKDGEKLPRKRVQVAKDLAQKFGFKDYRLISLTEMEFSQDEEEFLQDILLKDL
eukprot:403337874